MRTLLTILGAGLLLAGAAVLIGPTFGFTLADVDRGVSIDTAATEDALLAINGTDESPTQQEDAAVVEIRNNAGVDFNTLETTVAIDDDRDAVEISEPFEDSLAGDEQTSLELTCSGGGEGTATVSVDADATGSGLSVSGVSYEHTVFYRCTGQGDPGGGFQSVSAEDVSGSGTVTQTVSFTPEGRISGGDSVQITLTSITSGGFFTGDGLDYSSATPSVSGSNDRVENIDRSESSITFEVVAQGNINDGSTITIVVDDIAMQGGTFDFGIGIAEFTRSDTNETTNVFFEIEESTTQSETAVASAGSLSSQESTTTVTQEELEAVNVDRLETVDTVDDLAKELESRAGVEIVDESE